MLCLSDITACHKTLISFLTSSQAPAFPAFHRAHRWLLCGGSRRSMVVEGKGKVVADASHTSITNGKS